MPNLVRVDLFRNYILLHNWLATHNVGGFVMSSPEEAYADQFAPWMDGYLVTMSTPVFMTFNLKEQFVRDTVNNAINTMIKG